MQFIPFWHFRMETVESSYQLNIGPPYQFYEPAIDLGRCAECTVDAKKQTINVVQSSAKRSEESRNPNGYEAKTVSCKQSPNLDS